MITIIEYRVFDAPHLHQLLTCYDVWAHAFGHRLREPKGFMLKPDYKRNEQTIAYYATAAA
jgi:hypothetical protein